MRSDEDTAVCVRRTWCKCLSGNANTLRASAEPQPTQTIYIFDCMVFWFCVCMHLTRATQRNATRAQCVCGNTNARNYSIYTIIVGICDVMMDASSCMRPFYLAILPSDKEFSGCSRWRRPSSVTWHQSRHNDANAFVSGVHVTLSSTFVHETTPTIQLTSYFNRITDTACVEKSKQFYGVLHCWHG